jgi:hypothetical protein
MDKLEHFDRTRKAIERAQWLDRQTHRLFEKSESLIGRATQLLEQIASATPCHRSAAE